MYKISAIQFFFIPEFITKISDNIWVHFREILELTPRGANIPVKEQEGMVTVP